MSNAGRLMASRMHGSAWKTAASGSARHGCGASCRPENPRAATASAPPLPRLARRCLPSPRRIFVGKCQEDTLPGAMVYPVGVCCKRPPGFSTLRLSPELGNFCGIYCFKTIKSMRTEKSHAKLPRAAADLKIRKSLQPFDETRGGRGVCGTYNVLSRLYSVKPYS